MRTAKIKVVDLYTLQMEKQRLQMQVDYTEEQIIDKVSGFVYEFPARVISRILPFGWGEKQGVMNGIKRARIFISENLIGQSGTVKNELYKVLFRTGKTFVVKMLGRMGKKKSVKD